jgi:hypothetical protein
MATVFAKKIRVLLYCVLGLVFLATSIAKPSFASINLIERPEEELLILELYVNDELRNYGLAGYLPQGSALNEALFPIYSLSKALSFSIKADPMLGVAQGWFYEQRNSFQLDLNRNNVLVNGKERVLPIGAAEAHFDDIYIKASLIEEWFDIEIRPDLSTLKMFVKGNDRPFPFEEENARKKKAENLSPKSDSKNGEAYNSETLLPYQWIVPPSFVWQQSVQARHNDQNTSANTSFSLQSYGDVLKTESRFVLAGTTGSGDNETKISTAQGSFQKRDPAKNLLGPLRAGRVAVGDVTYPDVPLIVGQKRGRGVMVSSESNLRLSRSYGAETYDLNGDAPVGWDAELYRNGYFVAFQTVGVDGRYNFEEVELVRGYNLFQITLYGPEGQKRTYTQRVVRGQEMLPEGEMNYEFAAGQPDADFLPIADNARTNPTLGASGSIAYGFKNYLTLGTSFFTGADNTNSSDNRLSAVNLSAVVSALGIKLQGLLMLANESRNAYETEVTTRFAGANISASHTLYEGFEEEDRDLVSTSKVGANRNFGAFSANLAAEKNKYQQKDDEIVVNGNVGARISGVSISNSMERTFSDNEAQEGFEGNLSLLTDLMDWRLRGELEYDLERGAKDKMRSANISAYKKLTKTASMRFNTAYDFPSDITTADLRYSLEMDKYSIDINAGASSQNSYFSGLTLRTGYKPDHEGKYALVSAKDGGLGAVGLRAYLDKNANHTYDMGEELLPNITFRSNRGLVDKQTDQNGTVFVSGLTEGLTRFELDEASLPSIYIKPYEDYVEIIPRSGAMTMLYVGFEQLGEIDGFVYVDVDGQDKKPYPGIDLSLFDSKTGEEVRSVTSEYDGYFVFSAIPLGSYRVQAIPMWDGDELPSINVNLSHERSIVTDQNFFMPQRSDSLISERVLASSEHPDVRHEIEDEPLPVITDGLDLATGEPLRGLFMHFSSMSSFDGAQDEQKQLWRDYKILEDVPLYIYRISVGGKVFYRIVGAVNNYEQGHDTCTAFLKANTQDDCRLIEL